MGVGGGGGEFGGGEQTYSYEKLPAGGRAPYPVNEIAPRPQARDQVPVPDSVLHVTKRIGSANTKENSDSRRFPNPARFFETKSVAKPEVEFNSITEVTLNSAHFDGKISANYPGGLESEAEAAYATHWEYTCQPVCPDLEGGDVAPNDPTTPVSVDANRLEANTFYEVSLYRHQQRAARPLSKNPSRRRRNLLPWSSSAGASDGKGGYTLEGTVTPYNSKVTDCHFEYGPTVAYVYKAPCSPTPTGRDEVQFVRVLGVEGDFRLTFRGATTGEHRLGHHARRGSAGGRRSKLCRRSAPAVSSGSNAKNALLRGLSPSPLEALVSRRRTSVP